MWGGDPCGRPPGIYEPVKADEDVGRWPLWSPAWDLISLACLRATGKENHMSKFIFVTGGVASSVGKGITVASLGRLLKNRGVSVSLMKLDPYINVDPGTMSPYQHGEVFVTDDGAETDLDLGHYERFTDEPAGQAN